MQRVISTQKFPTVCAECRAKPRMTRDREHDAGRGGEKILVRQAEHLHEVGHRAFAAVVLPVGIGDEAHRRVERQVFADGGLARGVERQSGLQAHQDIENEKAAEMEQQHADGINEPALFAPLVDAGEFVDGDFNGPQERRKKVAFAVEDARHEAAEHRRDRDDDRAIEQNLNPADDGHDRCPFRTARGGAVRR